RQHAAAVAPRGHGARPPLSGARADERPGRARSRAPRRTWRRGEHMAWNGRRAGNQAEVIDAVVACLESLDHNCLGGVADGLTAMTRRDLSRGITPVTAPVEAASDDPRLVALVEHTNRILERTQAAVAAYNQVQARLSQVLGGESCLDELRTGME